MKDIFENSKQSLFDFLVNFDEKEFDKFFENAKSEEEKDFYRWLWNDISSIRNYDPEDPANDDPEYKYSKSQMTIVLDEEKVINDDKYYLDIMWENIDNIVSAYHGIKISKGVYVWKKNKDMRQFPMVLEKVLCKRAWFKEYVKFWTDENNNDLINYCKEVGKWNQDE